MNEAFVYIWNDNLTGRMYVGVHKGTLDDGYICSSKPVLEQMRRRPTDWKRVIVAEGLYENMLHIETNLLNKVNARCNPMYYNMHNGDGKFYNKYHSEETKQKIRVTAFGNKKGQANKGKPRPDLMGNKSRLGQKQSLEEKQKRSYSLKKAYKEGRKISWNKGKTYQELGIDTAKFGHIPWNKNKSGYSTALKGSKLTIEHRQKLSEAHKGKIPWNKGLRKNG